MRRRLFCRLWLAVMAGAIGGCNSGNGFFQPDSASASKFQVSGTVSGLTGSGLSLLLNGANATSAGNGSFTFTASVASGSSYAVTVGAQPTGQTCSVNNGTGTATGAVTNVQVVCAVATFSIGGTVSGLGNGAQVVLQDNNSGTVTVTSNSTFTFPAKVAYAGSYDVSVKTDPILQHCTITQGTGTNLNAPVSNVTVNCSSVTTASTLYAFKTNSASDGVDPQNGALVQAADGNFYGMTYSGGANDDGTVFRISPSGQEAVIYSFTGGSDGANPNGANLAIGADGQLYGTTQADGAGGCGTLFKVTTSGTFTLLHAFAASTADGCRPLGGLTLGSDGNFYGTTDEGGANGVGTIFRMTPSGVVTLLHSFSNVSDGEQPYGNIVEDSSGNWYGAASVGGAHGYGTIFKLSSTGVYSVLHAFANGSTDGGYPYGGVIFGTDGDLYGMSYEGGTANDGALFKVSTSGTFTFLHSFDSSPTNGNLPYGGQLTLGPDGNFYGTTYYGGSHGAGALFRATPAGVVTVVYSFTYGNDGGYPYSDNVVFGTDGHIYCPVAYGGANNAGVIIKF